MLVDVVIAEIARTNYVQLATKNLLVVVAVVDEMVAKNKSKDCSSVSTDAINAYSSSLRY